RRARQARHRLLPRAVQRRPRGARRRPAARAARCCRPRPSDRERPMIVRISDDALARALGADELAAAFARKGHEVHRTSSWGMHWLEPLVEIDGAGFGPATIGDVDAILDGTSDKAIGEIVEHPFIARQQRLTFARAGQTRPTSLEDYEATGGWAGLRRARQL